MQCGMLKGHSMVMACRKIILAHTYRYWNEGDLQHSFSMQSLCRIILTQLRLAAENTYMVQLL